MDGVSRSVMLPVPKINRHVDRDTASACRLIGLEQQLGRVHLTVGPVIPIKLVWRLSLRLGTDDHCLVELLLPNGPLEAACASMGLTDPLEKLPQNILELLVEAVVAAVTGLSSEDHFDFMVLSFDPAVGSLPTNHVTRVGATLAMGARQWNIIAVLSDAAFQHLAQYPKPRTAIPCLRLPVAFICARVQVPLAQLHAASQGDVIVVPGMPLRGCRLLAQLPGMTCWMLSYRPGNNDWEIIETMTKQNLLPESPVAETTAVGDEKSPGSVAFVGSDDRFGTIPIELRFEVTHLTQTLAELETWRPGHIICLPQLEASGPTTVSIVANGGVIGVGEIIVVGDEAGIQIRWIGSHGNNHGTE